MLERLVGEDDAAGLQQRRQSVGEPTRELGVARGIAGAEIVVHQCSATRQACGAVGSVALDVADDQVRRVGHAVGMGGRLPLEDEDARDPG